MHHRIPIATTPTERRLRREAQSAALRQRAFALRQAGATYAGIGRELGLSLERARQIRAPRSAPSLV
jgi:DNA-directed RNA polymerase sigma subunit (sigma70/sigma32)